MKRLLFFMTILLLASAALTATDLQSYLTSMHKSPQLPSVKDFGLICDKRDQEPLKTLESALGTPFSLNWAEIHIEESKKKAITQGFGDELLTLLPCSPGELFFSEPKLESNVYSVSVLFSQSGQVWDFLLEQTSLKIISIAKVKTAGV